MCKKQDYTNKHETFATWLAIFNYLIKDVCLFACFLFDCHLGVVIILSSITVKLTILQLQSFINAQMYDNFTNVHFYRKIFQLNTSFIFVPLKS